MDNDHSVPGVLQHSRINCPDLYVHSSYVLHLDRDIKNNMLALVNIVVFSFNW